MSGKITRAAFKQLIAEDVAWLEAQPRTLEREHIIEIVRESERYYYEDAQDDAIRNARESALRPVSVHEAAHVESAIGRTTVDRAINEMLDVRKGHE